MNRFMYKGAGNVSPDSKTVKIMQHENWVVLYFWNHSSEAANADMSDMEEAFLGRLGAKMLRRGETYSPYMPTLSNRKGFELAVHELYESITPEARMQG